MLLSFYQLIIYYYIYNVLLVNVILQISALALLKMVVHARSGGTIEVMGLMQGKTDGDAFVVMDAFALPVEGTETRVNAQADAYEYMVEYSTINKQVLYLLNPSLPYPTLPYMYLCSWLKLYVLFLCLNLIPCSTTIPEIIDGVASDKYIQVCWFEPGLLLNMYHPNALEVS
jgi:JAB1/Mov34/MPN/PAD-1 ubiquitin protease